MRKIRAVPTNAPFAVIEIEGKLVAHLWTYLTRESRARDPQGNSAAGGGWMAMSSVERGERSLLVKSELHGPSHVVIVVEDSAPGIDTKHIDCIFDAPFTTKSHGTGFEAHGGRRWISNRIPHGSVFHVQLPGEGSVGE